MEPQRRLFPLADDSGPGARRRPGTDRGATITDNDAIEARRPDMDAVFGTLEEAGIARDELYLAWDFTVANVRNITERILHIRDEAFADLGGAAPTYNIDSIIDFAPCDETASSKAC